MTAAAEEFRGEVELELAVTFSRRQLGELETGVDHIIGIIADALYQQGEAIAERCMVEARLADYDDGRYIAEACAKHARDIAKGSTP